MIIKKLSRYPIKGFNGEDLISAQLELGAGIVGDRRFAFGIDKTIDDGDWRSSRSYLINAINDNLLKFSLTPEGGGWALQNPDGETVHLMADVASSVDAFNTTVQHFMRAVPTDAIPRLIDRKNGSGPEGHWDFPDSELLVVNLATIQELEKRWGFEIDPKRFRFNILVDGLPAWSEFELYGSRLRIGSAQIDILRPARRCAATGVNPNTGDRDKEILQSLVKDYGHGFLGVYAKVSQPGEIAIGQKLQLSNTNVVSPEQASCDIAPGFAHWPKAATLQRESTNIFNVKPVLDWPLLKEAGLGNIKIHHGNGSPIVAEIQSTSEHDLLVAFDAQEPNINWIAEHSRSQKSVLISGPYARRKKR